MMCICIYLWYMLCGLHTVGHVFIAKFNNYKLLIYFLVVILHI